MAANPSERSRTEILRLQAKSRYSPSHVIKRALVRFFSPSIRALLIFGTAYALAFRYASNFGEDTAAPLWFPDSVLLCAFLVSPKRLWGWYLLVGAPIRLLNNTVPLWFLGATYLNDGLKAILSAYILQQTIREPVRLNTLRQLGIYMTTAVVAVPILSALAGAATRLPLGDTFWRAFYQWFFGDATAALALTPTLLYWWFGGLHEVKVRAHLFVPVILALAASLYVTFLLPWPGYSPIVLYAPLPLLILAATTLRPVGISTGISMLALVSIVSAVRGNGAFFMVPSQHRILAMQLFLIVVSIPMLFVAILIDERKAVQKQLSQSQEALRQNYKRNQDLAGKLLNAQEEERRRIARELHDDIGQRLALISTVLNQLKCELPPGMEKESTSANALLLDVQTIATDVHELSHQLHSTTLQHLGLEVALRKLCSSIARQHSVIVEFQADDIKDLPTDVNLCLFRVAQEALTNAVRHGKAKHIQFLIRKNGSLLTMNVRDEGDGFNVGIPSDGLGLLSMQERVRFLGGRLLVKSQVGIGTEVNAELTIRKSA